MKTLILNQSNIVSGSNNAQFRYIFPQGGYIMKNNQVAIQQISLYFSIFNITSAYNNNYFSYMWVDGTIHQVQIPNSFLQVSGINEYLQFVMISNGHYLINTSTSKNVYLLEMVVNQSRYAVQLNCYYISSALATANSWSLPPGATWVLPTNNIVPEFIIPNTNFGNLIGYAPGNYPNAVISGTPPTQTQTPSYSTAQTFLSSTAPQITPYSSFLLYCTLVNNRAIIPSSLIYSFTPTDVEFGALASFQINDLAWNKVVDGTYNEFICEIRDQNGNLVSLQDPNTLITLILRDEDEH
jgi:hypothetical protein